MIEFMYRTNFNLIFKFQTDIFIIYLIAAFAFWVHEHIRMNITFQKLKKTGFHSEQTFFFH